MSETMGGRRKKGRKKSKNVEMPSEHQNISLDPKTKRKTKPRRLTSFDELRNDTDTNSDIEPNAIDVEQDISLPSTSSNHQAADQSKPSEDDGAFKKPQTPKKKSLRKTRAANLSSNVSIVNASSNPNDNANASGSSYRVSREFDFTLNGILMDDDELHAYLPANETTLSNEGDKSTKSNDRRDATNETSRTQTATSKRGKSKHSNAEPDSNIETNHEENDDSNGDNSNKPNDQADAINEEIRAPKTRSNRGRPKNSNKTADSNTATNHESSAKTTVDIESDDQSDVNNGTSRAQNKTSKKGQSKNAAGQADASSTTNRAQKAKTKSGKSKSSAAQTDSDRAQSTGADDSVSRTAPRRRPSRDCLRNGLLLSYLHLLKPTPSKSRERSVDRQRTKSQTRQNMVPLVDGDLQPPKKKSRTAEPEIQRKNVKPSTTNSSNLSSKTTTSTKSKPKESLSTSSSSTVTGSKNNVLAGLSTGLNPKKLKDNEFWNDLIKYDKDYEIEHEDITYIHTKNGRIGE